MSRIAQPNYSEALKEIKQSVNNLSKDMSEIKALLARVVGEQDEESLRQKLYPWHFPNVTTSADYHEEEQ